MRARRSEPRRLLPPVAARGVASLEEANRYLKEKFEPQWKRRIERPAGGRADAHRKLRTGQRLASILSEVEQRVVGNDYTIAWRRKRYQIPAEQAKPRLQSPYGLLPPPTTTHERAFVGIVLLCVDTEL